jgi:hypothetical protein
MKNSIFSFVSNNLKVTCMGIQVPFKKLITKVNIFTPP